MPTLVVCSGGLDSVTLAYQTAAANLLAGLVSFDYGQRHKKELLYATRAAVALQVPHTIVNIASVGALLSGSALTDNVTVPDGHYQEETMQATVVPNRNAIMLTIAYGMAAAQNLNAVAAAVHGGDHFIYPDCRPEFIAAFAAMQNAALDGYANVMLVTPFLHFTKAQIVAAGAVLKVPFDDTWSCYKGGTVHCGRCGTCVERREAFELAKVTDPTIYEDDNFWRTAVKDQSCV